MKLMTIAVLTLLLIGCQNNRRHTYPPYKPEPVDLTTSSSSKADRERSVLTPAPSVAIHEFGVSVGKAIYAAVPTPQQYSGKFCTIRLRFFPDGLLLSISTDGDKAYCQALQKAASTTRLPVPSVGSLGKSGTIPPLVFSEIAVQK